MTQQIPLTDYQDRLVSECALTAEGRRRMARSIINYATRSVLINGLFNYAKELDECSPPLPS